MHPWRYFSICEIDTRKPIMQISQTVLLLQLPQSTMCFGTELNRLNFPCTLAIENRKVIKHKEKTIVTKGYFKIPWNVFSYLEKKSDFLKYEQALGFKKIMSITPFKNHNLWVVLPLHTRTKQRLGTVIIHTISVYGPILIKQCLGTFFFEKRMVISAALGTYSSERHNGISLPAKHQLMPSYVKIWGPSCWSCYTG